MRQHAARSPALAPARSAALERAADHAATNRLSANQPRIAAHELVPGPGAPPAADALGAGQPLPHALRGDMERRFGHDFARVRVHPDAAAPTQALHAAAFTRGHHIAFAPGRWAPGQVAGRALLAHELAHVVQQSALPRGVTQCQDAAAPAATAEPPDLAGTADSEIRKELVAAMGEFMNTTIGDPVFDEAMTQGTWDAEKLKESNARFNRTVDILVESLLTGRVAKRPPVAVTTTCVHIQGAILKRVKELKPFAEKKQLQLKQMILSPAESGVWNPAAPNMSRRPRKGDLYVLEFQDNKVVQLLQALEGALVVEAPRLQAKADKADSDLSALRARLAAHAQGTAEPGDKKPSAGQERISQALADQLHKQQDELNRRVDKLGEMLGKARASSATTRGAQRAHIAKLNTKASEDKQLLDFEFSHVGYVVSIKPLPDGDPRAGTGLKRERWITFDGGQQVLREGKMKEGATQVVRTYHPETNEISGEATQGRGARLLKGWVDVDKLLQFKAAQKAKAAP